MSYSKARGVMRGRILGPMHLKVALKSFFEIRLHVQRERLMLMMLVPMENGLKELVVDE